MTPDRVNPSLGHCICQCVVGGGIANSQPHPLSPRLGGELLFKLRESILEQQPIFAVLLYQTTNMGTSIKIGRIKKNKLSAIANANDTSSSILLSSARIVKKRARELIGLWGLAIVFTFLDDELPGRSVSV